MRVKRFNNLWTMGLIIFAVLLCAFYIAKVISPDFVVGVAQTPSVVKFGEFVDTHVWAYYPFYFCVSFLSTFFLVGAFCRTRTMTRRMAVIIFDCVVVSFLVEAFLTELSFVYNLCSPFIVVILFWFFERTKMNCTTLSICATYSINCFSQVMSLLIRDISTLVSYPNSATFLVLAIDGYIWQVLLYFFFNYKQKSLQEE